MGGGWGRLLARASAARGTAAAPGRTTHASPELAYQEKETAALVEARLSDLGVEHRGGVGGTGVVGLVRGARPGPTVLLRADMDALPITEEADAPYVSRRVGVIHACAHDAHTAVLLRAA